MILTVIVLLVLAGIAYWHYAQGLFSATFSAISAVVAAVIAVSYQEPIVNSLLRGAMADYANALAMVALFAGTYIVLRTLFDNLIPGNIRLPVWADRIGGGAMGVIAGIFATGIFVLAAEALPFGPSIGGYSRYALDDNRLVSVMVYGRSQRQDIEIPDQLKDNWFTPGDKKQLLIPVDDMVLATVQKLSDGGALAGLEPLEAVHPDYVDELFGQRLGIQVSAKRTALNLPGAKPQVTVPKPGVFHFDKNVAKNQMDAEENQIHQRPITHFQPSAPNDYPLVVRVLFGHEAADSDGLVRVSCGSVHLVADGMDYWPVGTVRDGVIWLNKIDDPLFISTRKEDHAADFIFFVNPRKVLTGDEKTKGGKIQKGVFISVKRGALIDLSGRTVEPGVVPSPTVDVMRKPVVEERAKKMGFPTGLPLAVNPSASPISIQTVEVSDQLCAPINVGTADKTARDVQLKSGTCSFRQQKFTKLDIAPVDTIRMLGAGSFGIQTLYVPSGQAMVQVAARPPVEGDAWGWANNLEKFALVDVNGRSYRPAGAWAKVMQEAAERLVAGYDSSGGTPRIELSEGRPTDLWIAFLVPSGTQLRDVSYQGKPVKAVNLRAQ